MDDPFFLNIPSAAASWDFFIILCIAFVISWIVISAFVK